MIFTICTLCFLSSTAIAVANDVRTNEKIRERGYEIVPDQRNYFKQALSFISDYGYLLIPGYNVYKAVCDVFFKYLPEERIGKLRKRGRLSVIKEEKPEVKKEEKKEAKKEEIKRPTIAEKVSNVKEKIKNSTESRPVSSKIVKREEKNILPPVDTDEDTLPEIKIASLEYEIGMLADADKYYRAKHRELKSNGAPVSELNKIARHLQQIRREYDAITSQIEAIKEKENSLKLTRK